MRSLLPFVLCGCATPPAQVPSLEDAFAKVQSSVVTILTKSREVDMEHQRGLTSISSIGSGSLISKKGHVLTAAHLVQTADRILVVFKDGARQLADVIGSDTVSDVALLKLRGEQPADAHVAALGDSDKVRIGQRVFVVGAPRGISHTLTVGYISARHRPKRTVDTVFATELFQTDAAINQGNSGGPMFNLDGELIGVVSHIVSRAGGTEGLGFAVTVKVARELLIDAPGGVDRHRGHPGERPAGPHPQPTRRSLWPPGPAGRRGLAAGSRRSAGRELRGVDRR